MKHNFWQELQNINKPILALAPMAGSTDITFRLMCKKFGADVVYTEMVSAAGLFYNDDKTSDFLKTAKAEKPVVCQLFGFEPEHFAKAVKIVELAGFDGVDINFGCPAKKVVKNFSGVALMDDLDRAYKIVEAVCQNTKLPVSIKIRNSKGKVTAADLVNKLKPLFWNKTNLLRPRRTRLGRGLRSGTGLVNAIMLHGRSYEKEFSGEPDWSQLKKIRQIFDGVILANGGIDSVTKAKLALENSGADGLGLARGIWGEPWLFEDIRLSLENKAIKPKSWPEIKKIILQHANLVEKYKLNFLEFRKHLLWYVKGQPNAKELREKLIEVKNFEELKMAFNS
ncbi:MAG: tRNA-dihydrouridine synthase [Patescibacteria group bacterium]